MNSFKFPFGTWRVLTNKFFDNMFGRFEYRGPNKTYVWGLKKQAGAVFGTGKLGPRTTLTNVTINGYMINAKYSVKDSDDVKQSGAFKAKLKKNGDLDIDYHRDSDLVTRWHGESAEPSSKNGLQPNPAGAGLRHEVRLKTIGFPIRAGASATLGNLEVRDLAAGWETHYAIAAAGIGLTVGVSIPVPSTTAWKRVDLQPRVRDWAGTEIRIFTKGKTLIVYQGGAIYLHLLFKDRFGKNSQSGTRGATWITKEGFTLTPKAEIDRGTLAIGKLTGTVFSKPYLAGAF